MPMRRILLVEDDPDVRLLLEHVLIDAGYRVVTARTMADAVDHLRGPYDLVIADVKLPDGTGMEVADAATAHGVKAILITGYAFCLSAETTDRYELLLKPVRPDEILRALERAIED
jgi:DNA-binding NtrC family response regulator